MISQSLESNLITYLLDLLGTRLDSAVKAQIVSALKAMTHNLNYGERVSQVLLKHPAWAEFKDQRHDLFIKDTSHVRGYLTGEILVLKIYVEILIFRTISGITPTAGYLTQGPSQNVEVITVPPPIDRDDPLARPTD